MNQSFRTQRIRWIPWTVLAIALAGAGTARAAECPASSPEDPQERRRLAKEWFAAAEEAENSANDAEATRAYACSYKMVAHPYTAFNLGRVAERSGESDLALKMFKAYLTLKPDAPDRDEVRSRVKALEEKLAAASAEPAPEPTPEPAAEEEKPVEQPVEELAPPPMPKPPVEQIVRHPVSEPEPRSYVLEWVVGGAAAAALVGGLITNLAARSKMSTCEAEAAKENYETANKSCDAARPLAYTSYALFGVAGAGVALDAVLLILRGRSGGSDSDEASLNFTVLPGGGGLVARGRF